MPKLKIFLKISIVIALLLIIMPYLIGLLIQFRYHIFAAQINSSEDLQVELKSYHRRWFSTDLEMEFKFISPYMKSLQVGNLPQESPQPIVFRIKQTLQHGPVFYQPIHLAPYMFGIAAIKSTVSIPGNTNQAIQFVTKDNDYSYNDESLVNLLGRYNQNISLPPIEINYPENNLSIHTGKISGSIKISALFNRVSGTLNPVDIKIDAAGRKISIPVIHFTFKYKETATKLWLGKTDLDIPETIFYDEDDTQVGMVTGFRYRGISNEIAGLVQGARDLRIDSIQYDKENIGPIYLQLSVSNLDAQSIADLILAYKKILRSGELYQSQLKQKIWSYVPKIFTQQSNFSLGTFSVSTNTGRLFFQGELARSNQQEIGNFLDFIKTVDFKARLRISKRMFDELMKSAAQMPIFFKIDPSDQSRLQQLETELDNLAQLNTMTLINLVQSQRITEDSALQLLNIQKDGEMKNQYQDFVRTLFLRREISRETSYFLNWSFNRVNQSLSTLEKDVLSIYTDAEKELRKSFKELQDGGFVQEDSDDYVIAIQRDEGVLKAY